MSHSTDNKVAPVPTSMPSKEAAPVISSPIVIEGKVISTSLLSAPKMLAKPLAVVATASVGVATWIATSIWGVAQAPAAQVELLRFSLQVFLATVLGTLASVLVAEFNRSRALADRELEEGKQSRRNAQLFAREMLQRITMAYSGAKGLRRIVRGKLGIDENGREVLGRRTYQWCIAVLNSRQLELEGIARELRHHPGTMACSEDARSKIRHMENALRLVIREYEGEFRNQRTQKSIPLDALPHLGEFIHDGDQRLFDREVMHPFREVVGMLRHELS